MGGGNSHRGGSSGGGMFGGRMGAVDRYGGGGGGALITIASTIGGAGTVWAASHPTSQFLRSQIFCENIKREKNTRNFST